MSSVKIGDLQINEEGNIFTWNGNIFDGRHALMLESEAAILDICESHAKQFVQSEDDIKIECKLEYFESELFDVDQEVSFNTLH
ncbi:unnamed protein product [Trichogramma brassicae]|uniref:Uncharacterized protein n=1 Tax=Trichogramma brassicae TaxID=86971 RepID=A0A6H5IMV3_9HYME|nr:unnamed protein product [Trichogramma brassicae]